MTTKTNSKAVMNIQVFMHNLKDGQFHAGVCVDNTVIYVKPTEPFSTPLASIDVYLKDTAPRTIASLHRVIDEAFIHIGNPGEAQFYAPETSLGKLEYLYRQPYAKNAVEAKTAVDRVLELIKEHPFK